MRLETLLRPELVRPRLKGDKRTVLRSLADCVSSSNSGPAAAELLDAIAKREKLGSMALGKGIAFCHVRTEKVPELTLALASCPDGIADFETPDAAPVKIVALFLIPKQHSDLYLRVIASLATSLSDEAVMERALKAGSPSELIAAFGPVEPEPDFEKLIEHVVREGGKAEMLTEVLHRIPAVDFASLVEDLNPDDRAKLLGALDAVRAAGIASHMHLMPLAAALRRMPCDGAAHIVSYMESARAADVLQKLSHEEQAAVLKHLKERGREGDVQTLLKYPESTAGGIMNVALLSAGPEAPVSAALQVVASFRDRRQTEIYVTSEEGRLLGKCALQDLVAADPSKQIGDVMDAHPEPVPPDKDLGELRRLMTAKKIHSLPVAGPDGKLLGVVTQDDLLEALEHEASNDLELMLLGTKMLDPLHTPLIERARRRLPWLLLTLGGELMIAFAIARIFKSTLEKAVVLAAFIPPIMATGGNVGMQVTTVIIRALGMGTLKRKNTIKLVLGEMRLGVFLGMVCGLVAGLIAYLINWREHEVVKVSVSVFLAMTSATLATSFVGTLGPLVLHRLKLDPATACGPFVTMFNDMFGSIVYLLIAMVLFR